MVAPVLMQFQSVGSASVLCLSAAGSALGAGEAGMASIGAWKKCYAQSKTAPFLLVVFAGAPLSQTIYGMILMDKIATAAKAGHFLWGIGIFGGFAIGLSAWMMGRTGAAGADALAETGKGFANYLIILGIVETVALFVLVFLLQQIGAVS